MSEEKKYRMSELNESFWSDIVNTEEFKSFCSNLYKIGDNHIEVDLDLE